MNLVEYVIRKVSGLPTVESPELISARMHAQDPVERTEMLLCDPHFQPMDPGMFGAISPMPKEKDFLSSSELHDRAESVVSYFNDRR